MSLCASRMFGIVLLNVGLSICTVLLVASAELLKLLLLLGFARLLFGLVVKLVALGILVLIVVGLAYVRWLGR